MQEILAIVGRVFGLLSIPMLGFTLWGLIRQVRKEQRVKLSTPVVGLVMAPITLLINIIFLHRAFSIYLGPALLIFGLGFGLAWGQTAKLYAKGDALVCRRSVLHLVFWGISYAVTQILSTFAPAMYVAGGLATMFFSTGSTLGTNVNLLVRQLRMRPQLAAGGTASVPSSLTLPDRANVAAPAAPGLPERDKAASPGLPERSRSASPSLPQRGGVASPRLPER